MMMREAEFLLDANVLKTFCQLNDTTLDLKFVPELFDKRTKSSPFVFLFIFHCQSAVSKSVGGCKVTNSEYSLDVILHNK